MFKTLSLAKMASTAEELSSQAQQLQDTISFFNVGMNEGQVTVLILDMDKVFSVKELSMVQNVNASAVAPVSKDHPL
ncbi:hypothetical protein WDW89_01545 [Deltaproteobacteria bacterium TL4]